VFPTKPVFTIIRDFNLLLSLLISPNIRYEYFPVTSRVIVKVIGIDNSGISTTIGDHYIKFVNYIQRFM
jgi:hypothetical protein